MICSNIFLFCNTSFFLFPAFFLRFYSPATTTQAGREWQHPEDQKREDALAVAVYQCDRETLWQLHLLRLKPSGVFQRQHAAVPWVSAQNCTRTMHANPRTHTEVRSHLSHVTINAQELEQRWHSMTKRYVCIGTPTTAATPRTVSFWICALPSIFSAFSSLPHPHFHYSPPH